MRKGTDLLKRCRRFRKKFLRAFITGFFFAGMLVPTGISLTSLILAVKAVVEGETVEGICLLVGAVLSLALVITLVDYFMENELNREV